MSIDPPVGVKFEIDGVEYVADHISKQFCTSCVFTGKEQCIHMECSHDARTDKTEVYFLTLQDYLTKRIKGNI